MTAEKRFSSASLGGWICPLFCLRPGRQTRPVWTASRWVIHPGYFRLEATKDHLKVRFGKRHEKRRGSCIPNRAS